MSTPDDQPPGPQRQISVADLLAQNGRSLDAVPGGHHRRRPEPEPDAEPARAEPEPDAEPDTAPTGDAPDTAPTGDAPIGDAPIGDAPIGDAPIGDAPGHGGADDAPAASEPTAPVDARRSPARDWAVVGGQLVVCGATGAGLWLGFRWLWESLPVLALVLALVVTGALVALVRLLRRADDPLTTVLAVVVGLVVAVSPAALTLTGR